MKRLLLAPLLAGALFGQIVLEESDFNSTQSPAWKSFSQRAEIAPRTFTDARHSRRGPGALAISGAGNPAASGGWERKVGGIQPGRWYRLTAWYYGEGLTEEANQVLCLLGWEGNTGKRAGQPEFAWEATNENGWRRITVAAPAPERAQAAVLRLWLHDAPKGTIWWDDVRLEQIPPPEPRNVTVATVRYHPNRLAGPAENVAAFQALIEKKLPAGADLIILPEGMTVVGTGKPMVEIAEPLPGPTTKRLGEIAQARKAWIVAGLYERDGAAVYNTAVLIDREGRLAGKYRKVYLPREEVEAGLTPGNDYPVFQTDFGRLGIMICWDVQYTDPARALALKGADLIALPIWDGNPTLTKARAIENSIFVVTSGYGIASMILDPMGETLASASADGTIAVATIDLNRRYDWEWLGNMKGRFHREVRLDVPVERP